MTGKKTVLVIDDDRDLCMAMIEALNEIGFLASGASSAEDAHRKLKNQSYACLIVDLRLGGESGEELVTSLRKRADLRNLTTPVIIVSGNIDFTVVEKLKGKIQGALVKPVTLQTLQNAVKKLAS